MIEKIKTFFVELIKFDHWSDYAIIIGASAAILLFFILAIAVKSHKNRKHSRELEKINKELSAKIHQLGVKVDSVKNGAQALIANDLLHLYEKCKAKRKVTYNEKVDFENLYAQYNYLGGMGKLDTMYKAFMELPQATDIVTSSTVEKSTTSIY